MLSPYCSNIITLFGAASQKERRDMLEKLRAISDGEPLIIVATGKYFGEGFDYPRLDTLFLALPISWKGKVAQYAGRLHRNYHGKSEVRIYDYVDLHIPMLEKMYQKRLKGYAEIGYKIKCENMVNEEADMIYDGKSYYDVFVRDLKSVKKEIIIASPIMHKNRLVQLVKILSALIANGALVTVITNSPENLAESRQQSATKNIEYLQSYGIRIICKSNFYHKFAIIDQQIVWYGSVNFLSFNKSETCVIRLSDGEVAGRLMDEVE